MTKTDIDIILICKGWYDKERYDNTLEAFSAYYHKYYGCEDIEMTKEFALELFLKPMLIEVMKLKNFNSVSFVNECLFSKFHDNMYDKIVGWVGALLVIKELDLSDYEEMFNKAKECDYEDRTIGII